MSKDTAVKSYNVVGRVEDITDFVTSIDPDQTLLTNRFGKTSVTSTEHGWLCDSLRPAMTNATLEAVDFETKEAVARKRQSNYTQQFVHGYAVTDITQAIKKYGVRDEIGYQMVKATKEIGRDLEYAIVANKTKVLGDNANAGKMGGIPYFLQQFQDVTVAAGTGVITLNGHKRITGDAVVLHSKSGAIDSKYAENTLYFVNVIDANTFTIHATAEAAMAGTGAIKPSAAVTNLQVSFNNALDASKVSGAAAGEFTFDVVNDAMQAAWKRGGNVNIAVMSGKNKRKASGFTANTVKNRNQAETKLVDVVSVLETDFGMIDLVTHRLYEDDVVDLLDLQYWKLGYLIPFHVEDVPRKGTYKEKVITGVATLECTAPDANARIYNLSK